MTLQDFRFLTDENIHPEVVAFLRQRGLDVLDVKECGLAGTPDIELIEQARRERRVILTHDSDFGGLAIAAGEQVVGIIHLRPGHIQPSFTIQTLAALLSHETEMNPPFVVVAQRSGGRVRVRVRQL